MKAIFVYSKDSKDDRDIVERVKSEMGSRVQIMELSEVGEELRGSIRTTPALIPILDHLQGEFIKGEGVDGSLILTASLNKLLSEDEVILYNKDTQRLDNFITIENEKAIDDYTLELIGQGVL